MILDFGCGVGKSTRVLAEAMPQAGRIVGMDLSPHMIAVGNHHNREQKVGEHVSMAYVDVTDTGLPDASVSLVSCTYMLHEMPDDAVRCVYVCTRSDRFLFCFHARGAESSSSHLISLLFSRMRLEWRGSHHRHHERVASFAISRVLGTWHGSTPID